MEALVLAEASVAARTSFPEVQYKYMYEKVRM